MLGSGRNLVTLSLLVLSLSSAKSPSSTCSVSPFSSANSSPISALSCDSESSKQRARTPQPRRDTQAHDKNGLPYQCVDSFSLLYLSLMGPFLTTFCAAVPATTPPVNCGEKLSNSTPIPISFATKIHTKRGSLLGTSNSVPMKGFVHEVPQCPTASGSIFRMVLCLWEGVHRAPSVGNHSIGIDPLLSGGNGEDAASTLKSK
ncbi:hypothetical protein EV368DRAFT_90077 [Lentinula lateritia]|nr:hypothetical protein EV368DRAFT_90077 [Lentinula lateritia]